MERIKKYVLLHLNILLFSLPVFFQSWHQWNIIITVSMVGNYIYFCFLMVLNCFIYAIAWQKVIKRFDLSTAYANRSVYLIWSQLWAVFIFHESLSVHNIVGICVVFIGVLVVQRYEANWLMDLSIRCLHARSISSVPIV